MDEVGIEVRASSGISRRGLLAAAIGAPLLTAVGVSLIGRTGGQAPRPPLAGGGNLVQNPGFELDGIGTKFTSWVLGVPLAQGTEGIPPTQ